MYCSNEKGVEGKGTKEKLICVKPMCQFQHDECYRCTLQISVNK